MDLNPIGDVGNSFEGIYDYTTNRILGNFAFASSVTGSSLINVCSGNAPVAPAKHVLASTANIRNICVVLITVMLTTAIDRDICVCNCVSMCAESHIRQGLAWLFSCQDKHSNTATQTRTLTHTRIRPDRTQCKHIIHINVSTCAESSGDSFHFNCCANLPPQLAPWLCA